MREATKRKIEIQIAQQKIIKQKDANFQVQLQLFLENPETVALVDKYDRFLQHMFRFYCM